MTTTEQAQKVEERLRYGMYVDGRDLQAADTIDALVAENERLTATLAERDAEIVGWREDQKENLAWQLELHGIIAAQRRVLEQARKALESLFGIPDINTGAGGGGVAVWRLGGSDLPRQAITAIQEQLK